MASFVGRGVCGLLTAIVMSGCMPLGVTALGVGGSTAVSHTLNGITYRTFTASSTKVKRAALAALDRMEIKVVSVTRESNTEIVNASANGRAIQIQLEPLSPKATRMRVTARTNGIFFDSATATEIILQTEQVMERNA